VRLHQQMVQRNNQLDTYSALIQGSINSRRLYLDFSNSVAFRRKKCTSSRQDTVSVKQDQRFKLRCRMCLRGILCMMVGPERQCKFLCCKGSAYSNLVERSSPSVQSKRGCLRGCPQHRSLRLHHRVKGRNNPLCME
jgi:hypothetical protein